MSNREAFSGNCEDTNQQQLREEQLNTEQLKEETQKELKKEQPKEERMKEEPEEQQSAADINGYMILFPKLPGEEGYNRQAPQCLIHMHGLICDSDRLRWCYGLVSLAFNLTLIAWDWSCHALIVQFA